MAITKLKKNLSGHGAQKISKAAPTQEKLAAQIAAVIGNNIRTKRKLLGLSLEEVGTLCNLSYQQIQKYETAYNVISAPSLYNLSSVLNVPISYFFQGLEKSGSSSKNYVADSEVLGDLSAREISDIIHLFSSIKSKKLRKALLHTIECVAEEQSL